MNGFLIDMILLQIRNMIGKYSKQVLLRLEEQKVVTPQIRKAILDGFNDLFRELETRLNSFKG